MTNFVFYDLETSGLNKNFDQIFQFAAVLTDKDLNVIDEFELRSRRMSHIVPNPGALLVTGIKPETIDQAQYSYYEFATEIRNKLLTWSPAIISGYNTLSFDEHFLRSLFYQNLYPPYLTQTNGNSRLDVLPLVRAAEHLYPGLITYPTSSRGRTSKRLEDVAPLNGFKAHQAHDAMGDVMATIHLAKILKSSAPLLWRRALSATSRPSFNSVLKKGEITILHDHNNGWPVTLPVFEIGKVDGGKNTLFFDLRCDPSLLDSANLKSCFSGRSRPFRVCRDSEIPLTFTLEDWTTLKTDEIFDLDLAFQYSQALQSHVIFEEVINAFDETRKAFEVSEYVEMQIYDDFYAFDDEKWLINEFHSADPELKITLTNCFKDKRFREFARRIVFESFRNFMSTEKLFEYDERIKNRINVGADVPWTTVPKALSECDLLLQDKEDKAREINDIKDYLVGLR